MNDSPPILSSSKKPLLGKLSSGAESARSPEWEREYRRHQVHEDRDRARWALAVGAIGVSIFAYSDFVLLGLTLPFYLLILGRALFCGVAIASLVLLSKTPSPRQFDALLLVGTLLVGALSFGANLTRPPAYQSNNYVDILVLLCFYLVIPNRFGFQLLSALLMTGLNLTLLATIRRPEVSLSIIAITVGYAAANILGIAVSRSLNRSRRREFSAQRRAEEHARQAEKARRQAERASEAKSLFLANVSHEISHPPQRRFGSGGAVGELFTR